MTYPFDKRSFRGRLIGAVPGDVFHWNSVVARKEKYHVCLSWDYDFLFLNTPKDTRWYADFEIRSDHLHFLKPTSQNFSAVGCRQLQKVGDEATFNRFHPQHQGNLRTPILIKLICHVSSLRTLETEDAERLTEAAEAIRKSMR